MKCVRFVIVPIAVLAMPLLFFIFINIFRDTCKKKTEDKIEKCANEIFFCFCFIFNRGLKITYRQVFSIHYRWDEGIESDRSSIESIWLANNVDSIFE